MDKKVRVFHVSRDECLGVFPHSDIVTSVKFHPTDESLFLTGSFDEKLRLFNLRDRELIHFNDTKYMITSVGFNGDGKIAMAGTFNGKCLFYNLDLTEGFKKITLLDVKSRKGKNKGRKVTGLHLSKDKDQVLISTNDSRIRLYSLHDYSQSCKYIGLGNQESQISGTFSHDGSFIISGSEDNSVYIWNTNNDFASQSLFSKSQKDKNVSFESFSDHSSIVTNASFPPFDIYSKKGMKKNEKKKLDSSDYVVFTGDFKGEIRVFQN
jgi:WD repeat-containing protein 44